MSSSVFTILPQYAYGDPARIVEQQQLRDLGCRACVRSELAFGIAICGKSLKFPACRRVQNGYQLRPEAEG
jgi:hypothetical protein